MTIEDNLIIYLEDLSMLALSDEEKIKIKDELSSIFTETSKILELNTDGFNECINPINAKNVFRDDIAVPFKDRDLILKNAARKTDEMFIAPKTVD